MNAPWFFIITSLLLFIPEGCRKNDDTEPPTIQIISPLRYSTYNVYDFFWVKANITDNRNIESVDIKILDPGGSFAVPAWHLEVGTVTCLAEQYFYLGDIHLPSGQYTVRVEAWDGTHRKTAFTEINVNEVPRQLKRIMITRNSPSTVYLDSIAGNQVNNYYSYAGDYSGAAVDSYWQLIYLQGSEISPLQALRASDMLPAWSAAAQPNGSLPYFLKLWYSAQRQLIYSTNDYGELKAYNKNMVQVENILSTANRNPYCVTENSTYIIAEHRDPTGSNHLLSVHYKGSGTVLQSAATSIAWKSIQARGESQVVLAGNALANAELRIYDIPGNLLWEPVNLPAGKIWDMIKVDDDTYLIAHSNGIIRYTYSNSSAVFITSGAAQKLAYDITLGSVMAAEGSQLVSYNPVNGAQGAVLTAADSIRDILLLFNK